MADNLEALGLTDDPPRTRSGSFRNTIVFWAIVGAGAGVLFGLTGGMSILSLPLLAVPFAIFFLLFGYLEYHREEGTPFLSGGVWLARSAAVGAIGIALLVVFLSLGASILLLGFGLIFYFIFDVRTIETDSWYVELRLPPAEDFKRGRNGVKQEAEAIALVVLLFPVVAVIVLSGIALFNDSLISLLSA
ncbi:MAG: hypothetical protein ACE5FA_11880 [Dehalococcoidia bacterium]